MRRQVAQGTYAMRAIMVVEKHSVVGFRFRIACSSKSKCAYQGCMQLFREAVCYIYRRGIDEIVGYLIERTKY